MLPDFTMVSKIFPGTTGQWRKIKTISTGAAEKKEDPHRRKKFRRHPESRENFNSGSHMHPAAADKYLLW